MEEIKILFFVVGTFFGVHQSNIISEKTTVTISPEEKTIIIVQENLMTFIKTESDSINIQNELSKIVHPNHSWSPQLENFPIKEKKFYKSDDKKSLNLKLSLTYSTSKDLKIFGINKNNDGKLSMTNFPKSHTTSTDGTLEEPYWNFENDKPFTFTEEPLTDLPEAFQKIKKNLLPFWLALK
ncbi:hypothetical protein DFQ09_104127 [Winogradskyella pacifica]|uniref:Uncharacterized protein n=1 Tax=Winogradskyella pacifica TaxID=664642 RepID=A0A3D9MYR9_9FLAO|nr:hypothetical protein [Winogradskyella pacifica]REE24356.1 hypothetical protein DFQ09_104127 [Winogradskyella pacifica]